MKMASSFKEGRKFKMGTGIDFPMIMAYKDTENPSFEPYFYFLNGHGDVTYFADTNFTEAGIESYEYNPWGVLLTSANKNNLLYTSREFDFDTGLQFNRMRYYRPNLGIFNYKEPKLNLENVFEYGFNSPLNFYEPFGEYGFWIEIMGIACCSGLFPNPQPIEKYCSNCIRCCNRMLYETDCNSYCTSAGCCGQS